MATAQSTSAANATGEEPSHHGSAVTYGVYLNPSVYRVRATGQDVLRALHDNGSVERFRELYRSNCAEKSTSSNGTAAPTAAVTDAASSLPADATATAPRHAAGEAARSAAPSTEAELFLLRCLRGGLPQMVSFDYYVCPAARKTYTEDEKQQLRRDPVVQRMRSNRMNSYEQILSRPTLPSSTAAAAGAAPDASLDALLSDAATHELARMLQEHLFASRDCAEYPMHLNQPYTPRGRSGSITEELISCGEGSGLHSTSLIGGLGIALATMRVGEEAHFMINSAQSYYYSYAGSSAEASSEQQAQLHHHHTATSAADDTSVQTERDAVQALVHYGYHGALYFALRLRQRVLLRPVIPASPSLAMCVLDSCADNTNTGRQLRESDVAALPFFRRSNVILRAPCATFAKLACVPPDDAAEAAVQAALATDKAASAVRCALLTCLLTVLGDKGQSLLRYSEISSEEAVPPTAHAQTAERAPNRNEEEDDRAFMPRASEAGHDEPSRPGLATPLSASLTSSSADASFINNFLLCKPQALSTVTFSLQSKPPTLDGARDTTTLHDIAVGSLALPCWLDLALQATAGTGSSVVVAQDSFNDEEFMGLLLKDIRVAAVEALSHACQALLSTTKLPAAVPSAANCVTALSEAPSESPEGASAAAAKLASSVNELDAGGGGGGADLGATGAADPMASRSTTLPVAQERRQELMWRLSVAHVERHLKHDDFFAINPEQSVLCVHHLLADLCTLLKFYEDHNRAPFAQHDRCAPALSLSDQCSKLELRAREGRHRLAHLLGGGATDTAGDADAEPPALEVAASQMHFFPDVPLHPTLRQYRGLRRSLLKALQVAQLAVLLLTLDVDEVAARPCADRHYNQYYGGASPAAPHTTLHVGEGDIATRTARAPAPASTSSAHASPHSSTRLEELPRQRYRYLAELFHYMALIYTELQGLCSHGYDACTVALVYRPHDVLLWMLRARLSMRQKHYTEADADLSVAEALLLEQERSRAAEGAEEETEVPNVQAGAEAENATPPPRQQEQQQLRAWLQEQRRILQELIQDSSQQSTTPKLFGGHTTMNALHH